MIFLSLFAFLSVGRVTDAFPFLWPLRLILVTGSLAAITWVLAPGSLADKIPLRIPQMRHVVFLMILAVASIPLSVWPGATFKGVSEGFWKLVLFFVLICYWCRSMHDARRLIWMCCLGLSCLIVIGRIMGNTDALSSQERFSGGSTIYDPNDLALVLVMVIPLLVFLLVATDRAVTRMVVAGMGAICLYGIILTQSRGGFVALAAVVVLLLFRAKLRSSQKFIIAVGIFLVFAVVAGTSFWNRMSTIWSPKTEYDETAGNRTENWKTALTLIATRPWGSGYGVCDIAIGEASGRKAGRWNTAHNSFLQIGVELGVFGLILFLNMLVRTLRDLRGVQSLSVDRPDSPERYLASMLEVSLYGFIIGGLFLSQAYSPILFLIIGLGLVLSRMSTLEQSGLKEMSPGRLDPWTVRGYGPSVP
jgi:probable O-glycosylation ligase (exosortase A-associated)